MIFDKDFQEAIRRLPPTEKDKLIFRLLKKDLYLASRLRYELVSGDSKEDMRKQAEKDIEINLNIFKKHVKYSTPGILLMEMRNTSGIINDHVHITKDKYGEVYLQIFLLKEYLKIFNENFQKELIRAISMIEFQLFLLFNRFFPDFYFLRKLLIIVISISKCN